MASLETGELDDVARLDDVAGRRRATVITSGPRPGGQPGQSNGPPVGGGGDGPLTLAPIAAVRDRERHIDIREMPGQRAPMAERIGSPREH